MGNRILHGEKIVLDYRGKEEIHKAIEKELVAQLAFRADKLYMILLLKEG